MANASEHSLDLRNLLRFGVALPAGLALANHIVLHLRGPYGFAWELVAPVFAFYVVQVAVIGWAVATYIQPWWLRWVIFGWTMLLVDLQLLVLSADQADESVRCLITAMFAGQFGLVTVWGILGQERWLWRLPSLLVIGIIYLNFYGSLTEPRLYSNRFEWSSLLYLQGIILSLLCVGLRVKGFSLAVVDDTTRPDLAAAQPWVGRESKRQFSIRDVLIVTTGLSALLGLAKAGNMLNLGFLVDLYRSGFLFVLTVAVASAMISIAALWAALGQGNVALRVAVALILPALIGGAVAAYCRYLESAATSGWSYWQFYRWIETGPWWIGWMFLIGALLAASLVIYRTLGYRLVRTVRERAKAAQDSVTTSAVVTEEAAG
jgi:hypothetical protein